MAIKLDHISPEVRALALLGADEAAAVFRLDKQLIRDACRQWVASKGRDGLRCFRNGKGYKIRPAAVVEWVEKLEKSYAENGY